MVRRPNWCKASGIGIRGHDIFPRYAVVVPVDPFPGLRTGVSRNRAGLLLW